MKLKFKNLIFFYSSPDAIVNLVQKALLSNKTENYTLLWQRAKIRPRWINQSIESIARRAPIGIRDWRAER